MNLCELDLVLKGHLDWNHEYLVWHLEVIQIDFVIQHKGLHFSQTASTDAYHFIHFLRWVYGISQKIIIAAIIVWHNGLYPGR